jgi:hypothetical protein
MCSTLMNVALPAQTPLCLTDLTLLMLMLFFLVPSGRSVEAR